MLKLQSMFLQLIQFNNYTFFPQHIIQFYLINFSCILILMENNLSVVKDQFKELPNNIEAEQAVIGSILVIMKFLMK